MMSKKRVSTFACFLVLIVVTASSSIGCKTSAQRTKDQAEARKQDAARDSKDRKDSKIVNSPAGGIVIDDQP